MERFREDEILAAYDRIAPWCARPARHSEAGGFFKLDTCSIRVVQIPWASNKIAMTAERRRRAW
jgi:hypothetical protein